MIEWVIPGRLARSPRPGSASAGLDAAAVEGWMAVARALRIRSILCLLDDEQLGRYDHLSGGLLETYRRGGFAVGHVPIRDLQTPPIPEFRLPEIWRLFQELPSPLVVHCWAGIDRTGAAVAYLKQRLEAEGAG